PAAAAPDAEARVRRARAVDAAVDVVVERAVEQPLRHRARQVFLAEEASAARVRADGQHVGGRALRALDAEGAAVGGVEAARRGLVAPGVAPAERAAGGGVVPLGVGGQARAVPGAEGGGLEPGDAVDGDAAR